MMLRWLLILRNRKRLVSPSGFVISQVCSSAPVAVVSMVIRTPSAIVSSSRSRPRAPRQVTRRDVAVSTTSIAFVASGWKRCSNVSSPIRAGASRWK